MGKMKSCADCVNCKISLPIISGQIRYSQKGGLKLRCTAGLWEPDNDNKIEDVFHPGSLSAAQKLITTGSKITHYFQRCAERLLIGEEHLLNN